MRSIYRFILATIVSVGVHAAKLPVKYDESTGNVTTNLNFTGTVSLNGATMAATFVDVSGDTMTGLLQFSGTDHAGLQLISLTTVQRNALTPANGQLIYNSDDDKFQFYENGAWVTISTGSMTNVVDDTSPQLGGQLDINGFAIGDGTLELLEFAETASAVNHVKITNAATGNGPVIDAVGDDTNVDITLAAKGTGSVRITSALDLVNTQLNLSGGAGRLNITESSSVPGGAPSAGDAKLWVRDDAPNVLVFTDDTGADTVLGGSSPVSSVFTRTGAVVAATSDYDAVQVDNTPAGTIAATNVQAAIDELDTEKVPATRSVSAGGALTGGGDLSTNRTLTLDVSAQTADATPDGSADYVLTYDDSAGAHKKVLLDNLPSAAGGTSLDSITAATATNSISNSNNQQTWDWQLTADGQTGLLIDEPTASTGGGSDQSLFDVTGHQSSTAKIMRLFSGTKNLMSADNGANPFFNITNGSEVTPSIKFNQGWGVFGIGGSGANQNFFGLTRNSPTINDASFAVGFTNPQVLVPQGNVNYPGIAVIGTGSNSFGHEFPNGIEFEGAAQFHFVSSGLRQYSLETNGGSRTIRMSDTGTQTSSTNVMLGISGDNDTGPYRLADDVFGISAGGSTGTRVGLELDGVSEEMQFFTAHGLIARVDSNQFLVNNGNITTPSISFIDDTDTGIYSQTNDSISILSAGQQAITVDAAQNIILGDGALLTTAGAGFLYLPSTAGTPTGVPFAGGTTGRTPFVYDSTNSKLYAYNSGWVLANRRTGVYRELYFDASEFTTRTTNGALAGSFETTTNNVMWEYYAFDQSTEEGIQVRCNLPNSWNGLHIKARFHWMPNSASTGDVVWAIQSRVFRDDDEYGGVLTSESTVTDSFITGGDIHISNATSAFLIGGPINDVRTIVFQVTRKAADAGDTIADDVRFIGLGIQYQEADTEPAQW